MFEARDYLGDHIHIDGRMIAYRLVTATDYFYAKGHSEEEIEKLYENDIGELVNQIMALKQSCFLLRRTSHSCGSLSDNLFSLKERLIGELKEKYDFEFDNQFLEDYGLKKFLEDYGFKE